VLVSPALSSVDACRQLLAACAVNDDWRLRFGAVGVLSEVLQRSQDTAVCTMVLKGESRAGTSCRWDCGCKAGLSPATCADAFWLAVALLALRRCHHAPWASRATASPRAALQHQGQSQDRSTAVRPL
jgi:hypothetical protein